MARIDQVKVTFRAPLAATLADANVGKIIGVGLNTSGQVVVGDGNTKIVGCVVDTGLLTDGVVKGALAGTIIDVYIDAEVVDVTGLTAGTRYWFDPTTGVLEATATGDTHAGFTAEDSRFIVRVGTAVV